MKDQILNEYKNQEKIFTDFKDRAVNLISELLSEQSIATHQINSRIKNFESLSKKIDTKEGKYSNIQDITDIIGIRIIAYMESDVDEIAELIENEFIKDDINSIDKRKLKADQFGYRSLHIVASLSESRCNLKEYKSYKGLKFEIQIRSILQHAWAEIEHDLGYKGETSIPDEYKRTFNRLSALLEMADIEFDRLKSELLTYENDVPSLISSKPEFVDINQASISAFLTSDPIIKEATKIIEDVTELQLAHTNLFDSLLRRINLFDFKSIGQLESSLIKNQRQYLNFVKILAEETLFKGDKAMTSLPLMWFLYYSISETKNLSKFEIFFEMPMDGTHATYNFYIQNYERAIEA